MSTAAVILIVAAVVVILAVGFLLLRPRMEARRQEREQHRARLGREVSGHRQEAESRSTVAQEAAQRAEAERRAAEEHAAKAAELEGEAAQAQRSAAFHEQRAEEGREELDKS